MRAVDQNDIGLGMIHLDDVERVLSFGIPASCSLELLSGHTALAATSDKERIGRRNAPLETTQRRSRDAALGASQADVAIDGLYVRFLLAGELSLNRLTDNLLGFVMEA